MADDNTKDNRFKVSGRQVLEFELLDEESKQAVIKCIQEKGRLSVVIKEVGAIPDIGDAGYRQMID